MSFQINLGSKIRVSRIYHGNIDIKLFKYLKKMVRKTSSKDPFSNLLENLFQKAMIIHVQKCFFKTFETPCIISS